jgi:NADH oxidase (H2O2-forming)
MSRIVVIGAGAAGTSAASTAKQVDRSHEVTLIGDFPNLAYSPCGIPYVFGREIDSMDKLFLQKADFYTDEIGHDLHLPPLVQRIWRAGPCSRPEGPSRSTSWSSALGWAYVLPTSRGGADGVTSSKEISEPGRSIACSTTSRRSSSGRRARSAWSWRRARPPRQKVTVIDDEPWLLAEFADRTSSSWARTAWRAWA